MSKDLRGALTQYRVDRLWVLGLFSLRMRREDISREIPCTACFSRRVREKNKNKKERRYI